MANSGGWYIFLGLFIIGVVCSGMNTIGIWNVNTPNSQFSWSESQNKQLNDANINNSPIGIFVIYTWIVNFLTIIGSGILAVFSLALLFHGLGWPVGLVGDAVLTMLQLPANIIVLFWLFELWTGR